MSSLWNAARAHCRALVEDARLRHQELQELPAGTSDLSTAAGYADLAFHTLLGAVATPIATVWDAANGGRGSLERLVEKKRELRRWKSIVRLQQRTLEESRRVLEETQQAWEEIQNLDAAVEAARAEAEARRGGPTSNHRQARAAIRRAFRGQDRATLDPEAVLARLDERFTPQALLGALLDMTPEDAAARRDMLQARIDGLPGLHVPDLAPTHQDPGPAAASVPDAEPMAQEDLVAPPAAPAPNAMPMDLAAVQDAPAPAPAAPRPIEAVAVAPSTAVERPVVAATRLEGLLHLLQGADAQLTLRLELPAGRFMRRVWIRENAELVLRVAVHEGRVRLGAAGQTPSARGGIQASIRCTDDGAPLRYRRWKTGVRVRPNLRVERDGQLAIEVPVAGTTKTKRLPLLQPANDDGHLPVEAVITQLLEGREVASAGSQEPSEEVADNTPLLRRLTEDRPDGFAAHLDIAFEGVVPQDPQTIRAWLQGSGQGAGAAVTAPAAAPRYSGRGWTQDTRGMLADLQPLLTVPVRGGAESNVGVVVDIPDLSAATTVRKDGATLKLEPAHAGQGRQGTAVDVHLQLHLDADGDIEPERSVVSIPGGVRLKINDVVLPTSVDALRFVPGPAVVVEGEEAATLELAPGLNHDGWVQQLTDVVDRLRAQALSELLLEKLNNAVKARLRHGALLRKARLNRVRANVEATGGAGGSGPAPVPPCPWSSLQLQGGVGASRTTVQVGDAQASLRSDQTGYAASRVGALTPETAGFASGVEGTVEAGRTRGQLQVARLSHDSSCAARVRAAENVRLSASRGDNLGSSSRGEDDIEGRGGGATTMGLQMARVEIADEGVLVRGDRTARLEQVTGTWETQGGMPGERLAVSASTTAAIATMTARAPFDSPSGSRPPGPLMPTAADVRANNAGGRADFALAQGALTGRATAGAESVEMSLAFAEPSSGGRRDRDGGEGRARGGEDRSLAEQSEPAGPSSRRRGHRVREVLVEGGRASTTGTAWGARYDAQLSNANGYASGSGIIEGGADVAAQIGDSAHPTEVAGTMDVSTDRLGGYTTRHRVRGEVMAAPVGSGVTAGGRYLVDLTHQEGNYTHVQVVANLVVRGAARTEEEAGS